MNVRQISVEFGATIPTASFANVKIGATWIVDLAEDESPELATAELYRRIRETLQAAYAANAPEPTQDSQPSQPSQSAAQPSQPSSAPATPKDETGGIYRGTGIARVMAEDGSSQFKVWYLYGNTGQDTKYPIILKGRDYDRLASLLDSKGWACDEWPIGERKALAINIPWTNGKSNPNKPGRFYTNYGAFDVLGEKVKP